MPVTIRSRLLLLVLAVLLPGMLGVGWLIHSTAAAEHEAHARNLRDTARAMTMLVEGELARRATIAHVLSQSPELDGALPLEADRRLAFEQQARRAMQGLAGWVELHAPGRVVLSTRHLPGFGSETPGPAALRDTAQMLPLQGDEAQGLYAAAVAPVRRNGQLIFNVAVTLRPSELQRVVQTQANPGWIGSVVDSTGRIVMRQPGGLAYVGRSASPDVQAHMARGSEGAFQSVSLDGIPTTAYFSTSSQGWRYVSAMPRETAAAGLPQPVLRVVVGALLLLALAVAGAIWVSRRIEQPIRRLKTAAQALQAGRPVPAEPTGMVECDEVTDALASAARAVATSRHDLEHSVTQAVDRTRLVEQRGAQSQRVEALGRLTGGVAHEFNNLLGIVSNSMHLMQRHAAAAELQAPLAATQRAVDKGSQLTQHLLRFSGRRPGVRLQTLQLATYLPEVQELLRSVLGRHIEIRVQVAPDVQPVRVDTSELDLALVNLALNAHDAQPNGGQLRLAVANATADDLDGLQLPAGDYVLLTVSDDGTGMEPELAEHAFEPFFTTKAVGQGSGLGLSQVYGFATQAGGTARLDSTPGIGTTVSLLLPVAAGAAQAGPRAATPAAKASIAGAAVLLVEDEEALRDVTAELLAAHGARVMRARNADAALRLLDAGAAIDVMLSDIVMPGSMNGVALARRLREQRPDLPVVLITGFSNTAMAEGEFTVLRKPCAPADLIAALQVALAK